MNRHPLAQHHYCSICGSNRYIEYSPISKKCQACGYIDYFNPKAAVVAIITNENSEILIAKRAIDPAKGTLDLPGGFCERFETAEEAIIREVNEETGLEIKNPQYLFSLPNIYPFNGFEIHTLDLFFHSQVSSQMKIEANDDVCELIWTTLSKINPIDFGLHSIKMGVEKYLETKNISFQK